MQLEKYGYTVRTVTTGEKALEAVETSSDIDLILMDIKLGDGIDGTQAAEIIIRDHDIPIVLISSHTDPEIVEKMEKITSYGYVVKDSGVTVLVASIKMAFKLFDTVSAHKQAKEKLRETEKRFALATQSADLGIWDWDIVNNDMTWNEQMFRLYGVSDIPEDYGVEIWMNGLHPEDREFAMEAVQAAVRGEKEYDIEFRVQWADGSVRYVHGTGVVIHADDGTPVRMTGINDDITERKQAEKALIESEKRYKSVEKAAELGIWEMDIETGETFWSDEFFRICGYVPGSIVPNSDTGFSLIHNDDKDRAAQAVTETIDTGKPYSIEKRIVRPDGEIRWVYSVGEVKFDENGTAKTLVGSFQDITERKKAENKIRQLLTDKETLIGEIQHRIKNNINTMTSLLSLQAQTLEEPTAIAALEDARNRLHSLATLYDHLYRTNASEIGEYLRQLVTSEVRLFPRGEHVEINLEIEECVCATKMLSTLGLIVNELVTNAMKYAFHDHPSPKLDITGVHRDEQYVLTIKDNGPGITDEDERQSSAGFGSMIVNALIEGLEGTITFKNDNGTRVTLEFPITE